MRDVLGVADLDYNQSASSLKLNSGPYVHVSVIIPTLNEADRVAHAISTAWSAGASEVVVVDGGSQDRTVAIASQARCKLLESAAGRAVQQNAGAREASGDVLLFQHADNWLGEGTVEQVKCLLADETVLAGAFRQRIEADGWQFRLLEKRNANRVSRRGLPFGDQGIFLRRETFFQLGGFPQVALMEDLILMAKVRKLSKPRLLPGPIHVDARRWQKHGVVRQTVRNATLRIARRLGASTECLARFYRRHDK